MSHYAKFDRAYKFQKELVDSLREVFGEVEVYQNLHTMYGYRSLTEQAHVIVRREVLQRAGYRTYGDMGFVRKKDGFYYAIVDTGLDGRKAAKAFSQEYVQRVLKSKLPRNMRIASREGNKVRLQVRR